MYDNTYTQSSRYTNIYKFIYYIFLFINLNVKFINYTYNIQGVTGNIFLY